MENQIQTGLTFMEATIYRIAIMLRFMKMKNLSYVPLLLHHVIIIIAALKIYPD